MRKIVTPREVVDHYLSAWGHRTLEPAEEELALLLPDEHSRIRVLLEELIPEEPPTDRAVDIWLVTVVSELRARWEQLPDPWLEYGLIVSRWGVPYEWDARMPYMPMDPAYSGTPEEQLDQFLRMKINCIEGGR